MTDLVEFLRAQNEATRAAVEQLADKPDWPAWVLTQCDAVDQVIEDYQLMKADALDTEDPRAATWALALKKALRLLALPYAWHPAYREEWRP